MYIYPYTCISILNCSYLSALYPYLNLSFRGPHKVQTDTESGKLLQIVTVNCGSGRISLLQQRVGDETEDTSGDESVDKAEDETEYSVQESPKAPRRDSAREGF